MEKTKKKEITPADEAQEFIMLENNLSKMCDEFKLFVLDSASEGMIKDFSDNYSFLSACLATFIDLKDNKLNDG